MNTRWLLNLSLLLGVIVLGVFISTSQQDDDAPQPRLGGPVADAVSSIEIKRQGLADISLLKTAAGKWHMQNPYMITANTSAINKLLELPNTISRTLFPAAGHDLATYGLAPEKASLQLNEIRYLFGNIEHINKRRYIMLDNSVHMTTDLFYHQLRTAPEHFINGSLLDDDIDVATFELPGLQLNRSARGDWAISGSKADGRDISADAITRLLQHWQHKQVTQITPAQQLDSNQTARLILADNSVIEFAIVRTENELLLVRKDLRLQYHFPVVQAPDLLELMDNLPPKDEG